MADQPLTQDEARLAEILTAPKQRRFVIAYVDNGGNGTQAAISAGYSERSAASTASRMLKDAKIQAAIVAYSRKKAVVAGENKETILSRMVNRANLDVRDYFVVVPVVDDQGQPVLGAGGIPLATEEMKRFNDLTPEQGARIKKLSWNQHGPVLEFHDPSQADRDIAQLMGYNKTEGASLDAEDAAQLIAAALDRMDDLDHSSGTSE
jgi:hypothetical protein